MQLWPYVISWCNAFLKIGFAGEGGIGGGGIGKVGRHIQDMPCTWWLYWLAVARP